MKQNFQCIEEKHLFSVIFGRQFEEKEMRCPLKDHGAVQEVIQEPSGIKTRFFCVVSRLYTEIYTDELVYSDEVQCPLCGESIQLVPNTPFEEKPKYIG